MASPPYLSHDGPPDQLESAGRYLYGNADNWQSMLARELQTTRQTIRHWRNANRLPGPAFVAVNLLIERKAEQTAATILG